MTRDCTAWIRTDRVVAECGVIGEHESHVGHDADGHLVLWTDADEGARRA